MKKKKTFIAAILIILALISLCSTAFAAETDLHYSVQYCEFRGNGTATGRNGDNTTIAIGKNQEVNVISIVTFDVDANTANRSVTSTTAIREYKWYGYATLMSFDIITDKSIGNSTNSSRTYSYLNNSTALTNETGDYYAYLKTSGASSAFYSKYDVVITYTVE